MPNFLKTPKHATTTPYPKDQWQPCPLAPTNPWQPRPSTTWHTQAHVATDDSTSSNWLLDSEASHHVSVDLKNLVFHKQYNGTDDIVIGDGTGLSISHIGSTTLSIPSHTFTLPNALCVPTMKRNLISISQFYRSNNTSLEFLPNSFFVKDLRMKEIFFAGLN